MSAADTLAAWGIVRPAEVVELAADAGLPLPAACTLLEKESGGGRNVWGSDPVPTDNTYVKGSEVTQANYAAYRRALDAKRAGAQGVGPCQLTWRGYQDQADQLGGCWEWRANVTVGFRTLAGLHRQYGARDGFRRYNGSGPAAEQYADDSMRRLMRWTDRLGTSTGDDEDMTPELAARLDRQDQAIARLVDLVGALKPGVPLPGRSHYSRAELDDQFGWTMNAEANAADALALLGELRAELAERGTPQIDYPALASALIDQLRRPG